jgi:hypothetical protein
MTLPAWNPYGCGMVEVKIKPSDWSDPDVQELLGDWGTNSRGGAEVIAVDFSPPFGPF